MATQVEYVYDRGESGKASVEDRGGFYLVTFQNGKQFNFNKQDGVAEWVQPITGPELFVELRGDNGQIKYLRPWAGSFLTRFLWFTTTDDGPREKQGYWATKKGGKGKWWVDPRHVMTAVLQVVSGPHSGSQMIRQMDYVFTSDSDGSMKISGKKWGVDKLVEFLRPAGFMPGVDTLPFSMNMLPAFEKFLVEKDAFFYTKVEEGWPVTFWEIPEGQPLPDNILPRPVKQDTPVPGAQQAQPVNGPAPTITDYQGVEGGKEALYGQPTL